MILNIFSNADPCDTIGVAKGTVRFRCRSASDHPTSRVYSKDSSHRPTRTFHSADMAERKSRRFAMHHLRHRTVSRRVATSSVKLGRACILPLSGPKGLTTHGWTSRPVMRPPVSVSVCIGLWPMIVFCCLSYCNLRRMQKTIRSPSKEPLLILDAFSPAVYQPANF